jgi:hypothetical protein
MTGHNKGGPSGSPASGCEVIPFPRQQRSPAEAEYQAARKASESYAGNPATTAERWRALKRFMDARDAFDVGRGQP